MIVHLAHLDGPPYLDEIRKLITPGGGLTAKSRGVLRAYLAGAFYRGCICACGRIFGESWQWWAH